MPTDDVYEDFREHVSRITYVGDAGSVLNWDQEVMMPPGGTPARSKQRSTLSRLKHELLTADDLTDWLDDLDEATLSADQAAVVREVRREHERARRVPDDLVAEISEATANALPVWEEAKDAGDFGDFEDTLAHLLDLRREYAAAIDPDRDPYAVLIEDFEPYLGIDTVETILTDLRDGLVPLIDDVAASDTTLAAPLEGEYPEADQRALVEDVLDGLGYDWDRGRLDTAPHPFSVGTQFDARVTTRFQPTEPLDALSSTVHEFGHADYTLGLPQDEYGTPLGDSRDMVVHESQSRFWENHVARSRPFWEHFAGTVVDHLGDPVDAGALYEAANTVHPDNTIRVEADELTYHLHIVLRFEIERDLVRGDLDVAEVPAVWNDKMDEYLGVRPADDGDGCLQDIHWSHASFGYFPTYSLGSVLAAQLDAAIREDLDVDGHVRSGEFGPIRDWLRERVHRHGCRYTTPDLIREATGTDLSAAPFLDYAREKYGALYDL